MINYAEEIKRLDAFVPAGNNPKFWKPETGQYRVKALTELEETKPYIPKGEHKPEDEKPQVKLDILVGEERYIWTISKANSPASAYGQLCKLATLYNNSLKNVEFMIVVTNNKKKNTYTIVKL